MHPPHHVRHADTIAAWVSGTGTRTHPGRPMPPEDVLASWKRCMESYRLDPEAAERPRILTASELRGHRDAIDELATTAAPELRRLYRQIAPSGHVILFTDSNGVTVDYLGEPSAEAEMKAAGLYLGALWAEDREGTNGVGTCIAEERPLTIFRSDHFRARNTGLTCTVSPVFDHEGRLVAVLDVSSMTATTRESQSLALELVKIAARRIEQAHFAGRFRRSWLVKVAEGGRHLLDGDGMLLAVDGDGLILGVDGWSRRQGASRLVGRHLDEAFVFDGRGGRDGGMPRLPGAGAVAAFDLRMPGSGSRQVALVQAPPASAVRAKPAQGDPPPRVGRAGHGAPLSLERLAGGDPRMAELAHVARRLADREVTILLLGETGTGKEAVAKAIHRASLRAGRPFVAVNCAALPETLIESELFGYSTGAFTGADRHGRPGRLVESDGGTLFLDEIGDMPLALQTRLLRVLAEGEVAPLGGGPVRRLQLSVISATHQDLTRLVAEGRFRMDLYYRLSGAVLQLPAFRERADREDLVRSVWAEIAGTQSLHLSQEAIEELCRRPCPGNARELRNALSYALAMTDGPEILARHLPPVTTFGNPEAPAPDRRETLRQALAAHRWCVTRTAEALGVSRATVHRRMKAWQLRPPRAI
jgi:sigma-54 dependent transcriptional regulator, acetoin dehydrogenase operon transcriptional activator AcoR